ncbi:MAG: class I SAM-dependent methyltransferase [Myxococcales bacterium]|nr:class I SAM-dependent methyltransferase [Myxococcales bacterium]
MSGARVVVSTARDPGPAQVERAREVAAQCILPFVPRRGPLSELLEREDVDLVYVVDRDRETLRDATERLSVHEGLMKLRTKVGPEHPFLRAVAPDGGVEAVLDATLGLAQDALHLAHALEARVTGLEASPVLACLAQAGLRRMAATGGRFADAAARITVRRAEAGRHLAGLAPGSWPVVLLDPMFTTPLRGPPGYEVFRRCAVDAPLTPALLAAAARVAARRVVVKAPVGWAPPPDLAERFHRRIRGKALDYLVVEHGAAAEDAAPAPKPYPYRQPRRRTPDG